MLKKKTFAAMISLSHPSKIVNTEVDLPASKSISNRILIIHYLMHKSFAIENLSTCNDTRDLVHALSQIKHQKTSDASDIHIIDVGEAGTSYRFLTALLATIPGQFELRGTEKLMQRPITNLVNALISLGAKISSKNENFNGPLRIEGTTLLGGAIILDAGISSQFITALMLIAPYFKEGLTINLSGKIVSIAYIKMTMRLMEQFGAAVEFNENVIRVNHGPYQSTLPSYKVESDWTAASYWYAFAALSKESTIVLKGLEQHSLQGDCILADLFSLYGVKSKFTAAEVIINKPHLTGCVTGFDFIDNPDLVQTFTFLNAGLGFPLQVNNASNLRLKETDRILAIAIELERAGGKLSLHTDDDFYIERKQLVHDADIVFETYADHRMAMAIAMLALRFKSITIADEQVVSKSYPDFWKHLTLAGFEISSL